MSQAPGAPESQCSQWLSWVQHWESPDFPQEHPAPHYVHYQDLPWHLPFLCLLHILVISRLHSLLHVRVYLPPPSPCRLSPCRLLHLLPFPTPVLFTGCVILPHMVLLQCVHSSHPCPIPSASAPVSHASSWVQRLSHSCLLPVISPSSQLFHSQWHRL